MKRNDAKSLPLQRIRASSVNVSSLDTPLRNKKKTHKPGPQGRAEPDQFTLSAFVRGDLQTVLESTVESESGTRHSLLFPYRIAALSMTGDLERALSSFHAWSATRSSLPPSHQAVAPFYLALALTRAGRYSEAQSLQHSLEKMKSTALVDFYRSQLKGFELYFRGDAVGAIEYARAALTFAEKETLIQRHSSLGRLARVLSLDLIGHTSVRLGKAREGCSTLKRAKVEAESLGHSTFTNAISISILKYESQFGFEPTRTMSRLYRALVELKTNDTYSRSELRLELARQLILRGRLGEARSILDEAAQTILGSRNRVQTAALHMRLAWIAKLENRTLDASINLQSAESSLDPVVDLDWLRKIEGFRKSLHGDRSRSSTTASLAAPTLRRPAELEIRMEARFLGLDHSSQVGEDPFGDLMDRVQLRTRGIEIELMERGYLGLLVPLLGLSFGHDTVVIGGPRNCVLVVDRGNAEVKPHGLKGILGRLLLLLARGAVTRRLAIESAWGYQYEATRHDRLLAVAVSRIRKVLGKPDWIEVTGDSVILREGVKIKVWGLESTRTHDTPLDRSAVRWVEKSVRSEFESHQDPTLERSSVTLGLRVRQLRLLEEIARTGDIGVRECVEAHRISRASALRDLNELVDRGFLIRMGATRATRYMLAEATSKRIDRRDVQG